MKHYRLVRKVADNPEGTDEWSVLHIPSGEYLSHHESAAEARKAIYEYEKAEARRSYMKEI